MTVSASQDPFADLGKRRSRPWGVVVLLLVLALVGGYVVWRKRQPPKAVQYVTLEATLGDVQETVETTGTVQPIVQVQVGSQVSGRIARVFVDFNASVRAGQVLAEIDPTPFRASVAQARAQVMSAAAQLQRARANEALALTNLRRAEDLRAHNLNAQSDVDTARGQASVSHADVAVASAEVARARASLQSAETNLGYTRIVSPIDGVVIQRSIDEGQTVAASFQAPVLFLIAGDLTRMRIMANIDEADIAKLREHLVAEARVDAFPGETFRGEVSEVRFGSTTTSGVVTYLSLIHISEPTRRTPISYAVFCLKKIFLMIRRPPRSTLSSSSAASDVYKRQAEAYAMLDRAARDAAARAVAEPRYEPTRDAARAEADALVEGLAWLRVEIPDAPAGLTVRVNGHDVQRAGLDVELPLDPGDVDVDVAAPGHLAVHRELTLHAGQRERTEVILDVAPAASRDPAGGASSTNPPLTVTTVSSPALRDAGIATATVGGAALVASLVLRLVAEDQFDTLVTLRAQNQTDTELIAAGERNQLLSYVFLGVGVTAAVTGTAMAISGARTRTRALTVVATPTSVGLGGSF